MMKPKVIKNEAEYQAALAHLETLMDAVPGSVEEQELEVFSVLIEKYEEEHYPIALPDPIEAIKFRMEQQGLTQKDLVPYLGSQSKVSEVLNHKRPLSLAMIRALQEGLDIPAEVLLQEAGKELPEPLYKAQDYPFTEMFKLGFFTSFHGTLIEAKQVGEELLSQLFSRIERRRFEMMLCRNSDQKMDMKALSAWQARVLNLAAEMDLVPYIRERITKDFIRDIVKLSYLRDGPLAAQELLAKRGVPLVILPHLPRTYLDGACFKDATERPIIGMTLRHDRLDNFWFTLIHELAHIVLHIDKNNLAFFDDTEQGRQHSCDPMEVEANNLAVDLLIPQEHWEAQKKFLLYETRSYILTEFANQLGISPAIVAGRIRWETGDYTKFSRLVSIHKVSKLFGEKKATR